jgi:uncharacterized protein YggT (Ycf19 family)
MSLDEKFIPIRTTVYEIIGNFFEKIAGLFGYPQNPGMPTIYDMPNEVYARSQFFDSLPKHKTYWPPIQRPETWFEMIVGPAPKVESIPRYIYESKDEGFYNFYIENYKNLYFLPDWASEFIQVRLNICLDITLLETIREVLFIGLMIYSQMVILRIAISWLIYINPYTFPWCYLAAAVDWTEDVLQGIVPAILGVNITGSVFLGVLGVVADSLNHLVFTMPFLPSEAEETKLLINQEMKDVLVFHYLPILWYRHPIPNNIREYWYYERPDIQFLPENIIKELSTDATASLVDQITNLTDSLPTEIVSTKTIIHLDEFINNLF